MEGLLVNIPGWIGTVSYLGTHFLVSTNRLEGDALPYQLMNLPGGIRLAINANYDHTLPAVTVNVAWICISLFALGRIWRSKRLGVSSGDSHLPVVKSRR